MATGVVISLPSTMSNFAFDELACLDLRQSGVCGKDLLRQGHSHGNFLLFIDY